jgi:hypothetical protein
MDPHPLFREFIKASLRRGRRSKSKGKKKKIKGETLKARAIRTV